MRRAVATEWIQLDVDSVDGFGDIFQNISELVMSLGGVGRNCASLVDYDVGFQHTCMRD